MKMCRNNVVAIGAILALLLLLAYSNSKPDGVLNGKIQSQRNLRVSFFNNDPKSTTNREPPYDVNSGENNNVAIIDQQQVVLATSQAQCHFEKAIGHFKETFSQHPGEHPGMWEWISDELGCTIVDYVHSLTKFQPVKPVTFVFVGDSLDRGMVNFLCAAWPSASTTLQFERNGKVTGEHKQIETCSNGMLTIARLPIFGMKRSCSNGRTKKGEDSRIYNTTAQRIEDTSASDLLDGVRELYGEGPVITMIGSCLWDLSQGCYNYPGIDPLFLDDYTSGIMENYKALKNAGVQDVYWRTCPPITKSYSDRRVRRGEGRTRPNQQILNRHLLKVVTNENIGTVIDWDSMISDHVPEDHIDMVDGRHYTSGATLAFVNMVLNTVFYRHEELRQSFDWHQEQ